MTESLSVEPFVRTLSRNSWHGQSSNKRSPEQASPHGQLHRVNKQQTRRDSKQFTAACKIIVPTKSGGGQWKSVQSYVHATTKQREKSLKSYTVVLRTRHAASGVKIQQGMKGKREPIQHPHTAPDVSQAWQNETEAPTQTAHSKLAHCLAGLMLTAKARSSHTNPSLVPTPQF